MHRYTIGEDLWIASWFCTKYVSSFHDFSSWYNFNLISTHDGTCTIIIDRVLKQHHFVQVEYVFMHKHKQSYNKWKNNFTWSYKTQPWQELIIIDLKCYLPFICFDLDACLKIHKRMYIPYLFQQSGGLEIKQKD